MPRSLSTIAPDWWDYTTLDKELLQDAAKLTADDLLQLSRPGFTVKIYDTLAELFLAEALEYIHAWQQSTPDNPVGICGPIGPTEQLPLVALLVNELNLDLKNAHFWGMDEWFLDGRVTPPEHPLSFERAVRELCFDLIKPELQLPEANFHFPKADVSEYEDSALRRDAGRAGRSEALGVQRSGQTRGTVQRRVADARRVPPTGHAHRRAASADFDPERAHFGRRQHPAGAHARAHRRAQANLAGR